MCSALRGERSTRRCGFQRIARSEGGSACHDIRELQRSRGWRLGSPNCGTNNLPDDSSANCCSFDHPHRRAYTTNFRANEGSYGDRLHVLSNLCANYRSDRRTNDGGTNGCTVDGADFSALNFRTFDRSDFHTYEGANGDGVYLRANDHADLHANVCPDECSYGHPHRGAYTTNFRTNEGTDDDRLYVLSNLCANCRSNFCANLGSIGDTNVFADLCADLSSDRVSNRIPNRIPNTIPNTIPNRASVCFSNECANKAADLADRSTNILPLDWSTSCSN